MLKQWEVTDLFNQFSVSNEWKMKTFQRRRCCRLKINLDQDYECKPRTILNYLELLSMPDWSDHVLSFAIQYCDVSCGLLFLIFACATA